MTGATPWPLARALVRVFEHDSDDGVPKTFKNEHLSVSRLKLYEQCPSAFKRRYIDKIKSAGGEAADFGVVLHAVLERVFQWVIDEQFRGRFPIEIALKIFREEWFRKSTLTGVGLYQEGLDILRKYASRYPDVDATTILSVEQEFNIDLDGFVMNGYIDRVDRLGDDWIAIIDYKSNRLLFSTEELENDLQMSIYGLAARKLYPWAKRYSFVFHMLRHGVSQGAERTAAKIDDHRGYVATLGRRTEDIDQSFPERLNEFCAYCEHRTTCHTYDRALKGDYDYLKVTDETELAKIAHLQQSASKVAKIAYARKKELETAIRVRMLKANESELHKGALHAGDIAYRLIDAFDTVYPADRTKAEFAKLGVPPDELESLVTISKTNVETLLERVLDNPNYDRTKKLLLKAQIESLAERVPGTPRFDGRPIKVRDAAKPEPAPVAPIVAQIREMHESAIAARPKATRKKKAT